MKEATVHHHTSLLAHVVPAWDTAGPVLMDLDELDSVVIGTLFAKLTVRHVSAWDLLLQPGDCVVELVLLSGVVLRPLQLLLDFPP